MKPDNVKLRKKLHDYVDQVDPDFLRVLHAMIEEHLRNQSNEIVLGDDDLEEIERRKAAMLSGEDKGIEAWELSKQIRNELGKITNVD
jgi:hypothetical protein